MTYFKELCRAMAMVAEHSSSVFIGQAMFEGTAMSRTFVHVPDEKKLEFPVMEDSQCGFATGIAIAGGLPVCCYPRINFMLLATNQLVLHLDKLPIYSNGGYKPKVLVRTAVAGRRPLDPGIQHLLDYSEAIKAMLSTVTVSQIVGAEQVVPSYERALARDGSTILIEYLDMY